MTEKIAVLAIEIDPLLYDCLDRLSQTGKFLVTIVENISEGLRLLTAESFDVIVSDLHITSHDGMHLLGNIHKNGYATPYIIFTLKGSKEDIVRALNCGADYYLQTGIDKSTLSDELSTAILNLVTRRREELEELKKSGVLFCSADKGDCKYAEQLIRNSEAKYQQVVEHANEAIVVVQEGVLVLVNPQTVTLTGYEEEELLNMPFSSFLYSDDRDVVEKRYLQRLNGQLPPSQYSFRLIKKDGSIAWVTVSVTRIEWEGSPATLNFLTEITSQKVVLETLRNSESRLRTLVQTIPDLIWLKDVNGVYITCNPMFERFFGAKESEIVGKSDYDFLDKDLADFFRLHDRKAIAVGGPSTNEEWITFADDGHAAYLETIKTPMYNDEGTLIGVLGIGRDITERKRIEGELQLIQSRLDSAMEAGNIAWWEMDCISGKVIFSERKAAMIGYPAEDFSVYTDFTKLVHPDDIGGIMQNMRDHIAGVSSQYDVDYRIRTKDGEYLWFHDIGRISNYSDGVPSKIIGLVIDITNRKRVEEALHESNQKLRLLTSLTRHDILNQISAIELLQDLALGATEPEKVHTYISTAQEASNQIEKIIGFTREYESFGIASSGWQQVYQMIESAREEVSLGGVTIENHVLQGLGIYADPIIRKVFTTLMENAIRHGEKVAQIHFSCGERDGAMIITCSDDGVGIPFEEKESIFSHGYGKHTGIGLFLSREILSITGLSIRECGVPLLGARFEIIVPAGKYRYDSVPL